MVTRKGVHVKGSSNRSIAGDFDVFEEIGDVPDDIR